MSPATLHDLKTPLNQIIGYAELLQEQVADGDTATLGDDLTKIGDAGRSMLALLDGGAVPSAPAPNPRPTTDATEEEGAESAAAILVVDDNEMNRDVLARRLERQGYAVAKADDGAEALAMLAGRPFDVVLLDVMMPVMDGYETLRRMKADEALRDIPVIMISANDEVESVVRCLEMGAEDYLPKPFNATLLKARLGASLEKKRARDRERRLFAQVRENYENLQRLEKQRDDLTHMIVHDMRTPLTSLSMGMQTLEAMGELNEDQLEMLGISLGGAQTLLGMVNGLLDVTKMESGSMTLDLADVAPTELAAAALANVAPLAEGAGVELRTEVAEGCPTFRGDPDLLRRTLVNLVGNAIKFTPSEGSVTLGARCEEGRMIFSVTDTGEGMPPEAAGYIFEKFGQVASRKGGRTQSTGLGLAFCRLAVETHGGEISVESELGVGSTFSFWLPSRT